MLIENGTWRPVAAVAMCAVFVTLLVLGALEFGWWPIVRTIVIYVLVAILWQVGVRLWRGREGLND